MTNLIIKTFNKWKIQYFICGVIEFYNRSKGGGREIFCYCGFAKKFAEFITNFSEFCEHILDELLFLMSAIS